MAPSSSRDSRSRSYRQSTVSSPRSIVPLVSLTDALSSACCLYPAPSALLLAASLPLSQPPRARSCPLADRSGGPSPRRPSPPRPRLPRPSSLALPPALLLLHPRASASRLARPCPRSAGKRMPTESSSASRPRRRPGSPGVNSTEGLLVLIHPLLLFYPLLASVPFRLVAVHLLHTPASFCTPLSLPPRTHCGSVTPPSLSPPPRVTRFNCGSIPPVLPRPDSDPDLAQRRELWNRRNGFWICYGISLLSGPNRCVRFASRSTHASADLPILGQDGSADLARPSDPLLPHLPSPHESLHLVTETPRPVVPLELAPRSEHEPIMSTGPQAGRGERLVALPLVVQLRTRRGRQMGPVPDHETRVLGPVRGLEPIGVPAGLVPESVLVGRLWELVLGEETGVHLGGGQVRQ